MIDTQIKKGKLLQNEAAAKFLQMMYSEHFLFNTINMIYGMALVDGCPLTAKAIQKFAEDLRANMTIKNSDLIFSLPA